ncbi:hypothetical protein DPMN_118236 [Dreissena polymorpha]|uniref:Uncharacterized protein n=1 Tax=Dreissena polymorpha TaxID=45954 RepID=A0A9D4GGJ1_DREPO|nr:hypothetical protein DPMN_118236 [Dreissena polymorpha]
MVPTGRMTKHSPSISAASWFIPHGLASHSSFANTGVDFEIFSNTNRSSEGVSDNVPFSKPKGMVDSVVNSSFGIGDVNKRLTSVGEVSFPTSTVLLSMLFD